MKTFNSKTVRFVTLVLGFISLGSPAEALAAVHALFDLSTPSSSPFPSDQFTVPDGRHNTRRRVNLPMPNCALRQSDCEDLNVINTLDGFSVEPRLSIPFDGPIDVTTVNSQTVFSIRLDGRSCDADDDCDNTRKEDSRAVGVNQLVWDPATDTLHAQSNESLDQHTRYALIVTRGVRDQFGQPVEATEAFRRFRQHVQPNYRRALLDAIRAARRIELRERDIVAASVFTTQSTTAVLEKIRDQIKEATPEAADFHLGEDGTRTVFPLDMVAGLTWNQQTGDDPATFTRVTLDVQLLQIIPGAVGSIAFGKYRSPDYEVHPGEFIPLVGTRDGEPVVQGVNEIYFNLFLPSGPKPQAGWPVAIVGHGNGNNKNNSTVNVAGTMAAHGIATIGINGMGAGYGPLGTLTVDQTVGDSVTFSSGGRGFDQNHDHIIEANEGLISAPPRTIIYFTDGIRQTIADFMQLIRVIEAGMDVDGDGSPDLDPSHIYYFGSSLGGATGTALVSIEPAIHAGVFNVPGSAYRGRRISPPGRGQLGQSLASRIPTLINAPGVTSLNGVVIGAPRFDENFPLRDGVPLHLGLADGTSRDIQSPVINTVAGALAIQEVVDHARWVAHAADPVAYTPHLRKDPLPGMSPKSVLFQFAKGDQTSPNPYNAEIVRAGDLADRATFYRHDLAFAENPALPTNPHTFMPSIDNPAFREISLAAQEQIAVFLASDGTEIIHPEPARFFEVPIVLPLPEALNFIVP